jgi:oligopeptide transport system substrate-binding protein
VQKTTPSFTFIMTRLLSITLPAFISLFIAQNSYGSWNNPYPESQQQQNILYSAFSERPKFLDPVRSYSESEYQFLGQIYEPPLQYHYLHRPYRLEPQTLTEMPEIVYFDNNGEEVQQNAPTIAYTEYRFTLQKGIRFQPHPALAKDKDGIYYYHNLNESQTANIKSLDQLEHVGTRELIAEDYVYQIKRIANPTLHSPINGLMQEYIVGLKELTAQLNTENTTDLRNVQLSGVTATNDYQFTIRIKGQYPQFTYWLAMPFFAPIPWEADIFYAQPGFSKNNINLNWYPIGTGAYMLTENNPNLRMVLEKNPNFRGQTYPIDGEAGDKEIGLLADAGKKIPFIEKVIYTLEKESIPYWNKFLQGYFDSSGISSDSFDSAINFGSSGSIDLSDEMKAKNIQLNTVVNTSIFYLGFNMLDPIVGNGDNNERARLLRQAIAIAIDYDEYISIFLNGRGIAGQGPIRMFIHGKIISLKENLSLKPKSCSNKLTTLMVLMEKLTSL